MSKVENFHFSCLCNKHVGRFLDNHVIILHYQKIESLETVPVIQILQKGSLNLLKVKYTHFQYIENSSTQFALSLQVGLCLKLPSLYSVYRVREANVCFTLSLILTMLTKYLDLGLLAYENLDIKWILEVLKSALSNKCDFRLTAKHFLSRIS